MAEWSIAAVLKTVDPQGSGGSNPSLSADTKRNLKKTTEFQRIQWFFSFPKVAKNAIKSIYSVA